MYIELGIPNTTYDLTKTPKKSRPTVCETTLFAIGINAWETYVSGFKELF